MLNSIIVLIRSGFYSLLISAIFRLSIPSILVGKHRQLTVEFHQPAFYEAVMSWPFISHQRTRVSFSAHGCIRSNSYSVNQLMFTSPKTLCARAHAKRPAVAINVYRCLYSLFKYKHALMLFCILLTFNASLATTVSHHYICLYNCRKNLTENLYVDKNCLV